MYEYDEANCNKQTLNFTSINCRLDHAATLQIYRDYHNQDKQDTQFIV